jgi:hypothetical protein
VKLQQAVLQDMYQTDASMRCAAPLGSANYWGHLPFVGVAATLFVVAVVMQYSCAASCAAALCTKHAPHSMPQHPLAQHIWGHLLSVSGLL